MRRKLTVHDGRLRSELVSLALGNAGLQDGTVGVNDGLGEPGGSRSEEENSLGVGLGVGKLEALGAILRRSGLLDVVEQLDVQTGCTGFVELTGSDLVGQPDGLDRIGSQEGVEVLNVSLAMVELSSEVWKEAGDETGAEGGPDGQHVVLVGGQVDDNDGLLASGRSTNGRGAEGGHERVGHSLDRRLEPRNIVDLGGVGGGDKGEGSISIGLRGPREHLGKGAQVGWRN